MTRTAGYLSIPLCFFFCVSCNEISIAADAASQLVQIPAGFGDSSNAYPFSVGPRRYQQIYSASAFPSVFSKGNTIDKIMFRNEEDPVWDLPYGPTQINLQISLAYAKTKVATASSVFADNIGSNFTVVMDEVIVRSNDGTGPIAAFDFVLDVANTFTYDPTKGDLLLQVLVRSQEGFTFFDAASSSQQSVTTRIWSGGVNATSGNVGLGFSDNRPYGLVTQFEFVPEPGTAALLGLAAAILGLRRSRTSSV
jgi:hypothetical protein